MRVINKDLHNVKGKISRRDQQPRSEAVPRLRTFQPVAGATPPSYCTIDRSRLRKRPVGVDCASQTLPRRPPSALKKSSLVKSDEESSGGSGKERCKSVEFLDRDPLSCEEAIENEFRPKSIRTSPRRSADADPDLYVPPYIGDCGIDDLRKASSELILDKCAKSVKIHPTVTKFHYPGQNKPLANGLLFLLF